MGEQFKKIEYPLIIKNIPIYSSLLSQNGPCYKKIIINTAAPPWGWL